MNLRIRKVYENNINLLNSLNGLRIANATRELYFYENDLVKDSMGDLRIIFSDGKKLLFTCDADAESIKIIESDFTNRKQLETDFDGKFRWEQTPFDDLSSINCNGEIINYKIFIRDGKQNKLRIRFASGSLFFFEITCSDCTKYYVVR